MDCEIEQDINNVTVTFSGVTADSVRLDINGIAKGASIALNAIAGKNIVLDEPVIASAGTEGTHIPRFRTALQGDNAASTDPDAPGSVIPGDFTSIAGFTMAYQ